MTDEVLVVIPAKSRSERVPGKNLRPLAGKPLLAWTVEAALGASHVTRTVLSVEAGDGDTIALADSYGVGIVPHPIPEVSAVETCLAAVRYLMALEGYRPATVVMLLATSPFRTADDVDAALRLHRVRGKNVQSAVRRWVFSHDYPGVRKEWAPNGAIWIASTDRLLTDGYFVPEETYGMEDDAGLDIDWPHEWAAAEWVAAHILSAKDRIAVFDLDGTLCDTPGASYGHATPRPERIAQVNELHRAGWWVVIDTARGSRTGEDWYLLTRGQLREWGVEYDELRVGLKPAASMYVDDRALTPRQFFGARAA